MYIYIYIYVCVCIFIYPYFWPNCEAVGVLIPVVSFSLLLYCFQAEQTEPTLKLNLKKGGKKKKIQWTEDTVDNEGDVM